MIEKPGFAALELSELGFTEQPAPRGMVKERRGGSGFQAPASRRMANGMVVERRSAGIQFLAGPPGWPKPAARTRSRSWARREAQIDAFERQVQIDRLADGATSLR